MTYEWDFNLNLSSRILARLPTVCLYRVFPSELWTLPASSHLISLVVPLASAFCPSHDGNKTETVDVATNNIQSHAISPFCFGHVIQYLNRHWHSAVSRKPQTVVTTE